MVVAQQSAAGQDVLIQCAGLFVFTRRGRDTTPSIPSPRYPVPPASLRSGMAPKAHEDGEWPDGAGIPSRQHSVRSEASSPT
jgi:hypothetical protein